MFWQYADSCSAYTLGKNYPNIKLKGLLYLLQLCWRYLPQFYKFLNLLYCSVFTVYNSLFTLTLIKIDNVTRFVISGNCRRSNLSEVLSNRLYILGNECDFDQTFGYWRKFCCVHDTAESNYAMFMLPWSQTLLCPWYHGVKFCYVQCAMCMLPWSQTLLCPCYRGIRIENYEDLLLILKGHLSWAKRF